jgi:gamma-glutamyltranspeptidase / glutathione hydrolase
MISDPRWRLSERPSIQARHYLASTNHYLATAAAVRILDAGGNATDAGVAAGMCINVLMPDLTSFGGVAPIMAYDRGRNKLKTISGLGHWSEKMVLAEYRQRWHDTIPTGAPRSIVPAAADSWITALSEFGSMTFGDVAAPAIELCEAGFPVYASLNRNIGIGLAEIERSPSTAQIFLDDGAPVQVGSVLRQTDLARTLKRLVAAEQAAAGTREDGLRAARDEFYGGDIAEAIVEFVSSHDGLLTMRDLSEFHVQVEDPPTVSYRGIDVYMCGPWCQGPVVGQTLNILEGFDLDSMVHNSADYLHLISQSLNLAFADRECYYGDPLFVDVPMAELLSKDYAQRQRARIKMTEAFREMPSGGLHLNRDEAPSVSPMSQPARLEADTSYVCIVDQQGNAFSATPSDGIGTSPVIPGLGLVCSGRGIQSWLEPEHPSCVQAGKRPRLTPNPAMAFRDGQLLMPFGTPGGDVQPQAMVQAFVNLVDFGMEVQQAIEQPRIATYNYPGSGWPHRYAPARLKVEARISADVAEDLSGRGHQIEFWPRWSRIAGNVCAIVVDAENGVLNGGADARAEAYAQGW